MPIATRLHVTGHKVLTVMGHHVQVPVPLLQHSPAPGRAKGEEAVCDASVAAAHTASL